MNNLIKIAALALTAVSIFIPTTVFAKDTTPISTAIVQEKDINWKNVPTQTITANGITFAYRELGKENGGVPVVFLVHLAVSRISASNVNMP